MQIETAAKEISVYIVDDSRLVRTRLADLLRQLEAVAIVGEAEDPEAAIHGILMAHPDFAVIDIHLRGGSGIKVIEAVAPIDPNLVFIVLSNAQDPSYRKVYLEAGAAYFLDKSMEFELVAEIVSRPHTRKQFH